MTISDFSVVSSLPFPAIPNQKFCAPVRLAPDMLAWAYVPTAAERHGDFSQTPLISQLIDPLTNSPFPGGIIPLNRLPDPFAWRISATGPASGDPCVPVPSFIPLFTSSYYVTGRNATADRLSLDRTSLVGINYVIGDPFPPDQIVNVVSGGAALDFTLNTSSNQTGISNIAVGRWLNIQPSPGTATPSALHFRFQPVGLRAGFYAATVTVSPLGAIQTPLSIDVGVIVQTPPNWITINQPILKFTFQPGGALPGTQFFNINVPAGRAYSVTPRVVSPTGGSWVGVTSTGGSGSGSVGVTITAGARGLAPGIYLAIVDIALTGSGGLALFPVGGLAAGNSNPVCGGSLSAERLAVELDVGEAALTTAPTLPRDSTTGLPLLSLSYTQGGTLLQPPPITFQPIQGPGSGSYDVRTVVRNPDPTLLPPENWLAATPTTSGLPATVTAAMDPNVVSALPPCDYEGYVAISNATGGAVVKLGFTLLPPAGPVSLTRVMSQIADGGGTGGWKTTIILVNTDQANPASFQLLFHPGKDQNQRQIDPSTPFNVVGPHQVANRTYADMIPPGGSLTLSTQGPSAPFWQGWAELTAPDSVGGTAIFAQALPNDPSSDAEGSVLLKPPAGTTFLLPFDNDNTTGLLTTMAIVNTSPSQQANVTVKFRGEDGNQFGQGVVPTLAASGHDAFALVDRFPSTANRRGVAEFTSDGPALAGLGLRFNTKQQTFTSFEIVNPQAGGTKQALAHVPDGGDIAGPWKTSITLVNLDPTQANVVTLKFHTGQSTPPNLPLVLENGQTLNDGTFTTSIQAGGSTTIRTMGIGNVPLWQGWAEVNSSTTLGGFAVFRQIKSQAQQLEGTVSLTSLGSARFLVPFDNALATGIAVVNTSGLPATVIAAFRNATGNDIQGVPDDKKVLSMGAQSHAAFSLSDAGAQLGGLGLKSLTGVADFRSTLGGLIGIGLRFSPRNAFTPLPILQK